MSLLTAITLPLPGSRSGALFAALFVGGFLTALLTQLWRVNRLSFRQRMTVAASVTGLLLVGAGYGASIYAVKGQEDWNRTTAEITQWKHGSTFGLRTKVSHDTAHMAEARPWFGWGIGSFPIVFPIFQGDYLRDKNGRIEARFEFAHNDWLQLAAETGLAGLLTLVIPMGIVTRRIWRESGFAGRWGLAGCGVIAVYAWIDFPFNNPAVFALWIVLVFTASGVGSTQTRKSQPTPPASIT